MSGIIWETNAGPMKPEVYVDLKRDESHVVLTASDLGLRALNEMVHLTPSADAGLCRYCRIRARWIFRICLDCLPRFYPKQSS